MNRIAIKVLALIGLLGISHITYAQKQPNILLILSDDQSQNFLGGYGNPDLKTPNLSRLAAEGVRFTRAYTTAPQCVPSRASLLTGRCPVDMEMTRFSAALPAEYITFPELLRQNGYYTGIGGRTFHLDGYTADQPDVDSLYVKHNLKTFKNRVDVLSISGPDSVSQVAFNTFLTKRNKEKPFFYWLNFSNPHRPWTRFKDRPDPSKLTLPADFPDTKLVREDLADLYAEIQHLDNTIGEVIASLQRSGTFDNTIIIFMGDNGSSVFRGKGTLYEKGLNVPLIVRFPDKSKAGTVCNELISGEDIAPSVLDWAGVKIPTEITGKSFADIYKKPLPAIHNYVFGERGAHGNGLPTGSAPFDLGRVVIGKRYKLIYNALWQIPYMPVDFHSSNLWQELKSLNDQNELKEPFKTILFQPQRPMFELFDLENDPHEFNNLIDKPDYKAIQYDLKIALTEWMILTRDYLPLPMMKLDKRN